MFQEVLNNINGGFTQSAYDISGQIVRTLQNSNNHPVVIRAQEELGELGIHPDQFDRNSLLYVWQSDVHFTTKYLATLWWGNVGRNFSRVFTSENMDSLQVFSNDLENALLASTNAPERDAFLQELANIIIQMQIHGGAYKISRVGTAFYTKILQFFYASNPIETNPNYLPVIADQWIMKAVYCEMTDLGDIQQRDNVFHLSGEQLSLTDIPDSYFDFISYFNNRSVDLGVSAWNMESYLFRNQLVQEHFSTIVAMQDNIVVPNQGVNINQHLTVTLKVYDGHREDNYGKTLQIVNNTLTEPHNTNCVYVEYNGVRYRAKEGTYKRGDTIRRARTIQRLIEDNHWQPGQELHCVFENENGIHIYRILESAE